MDELKKVMRTDVLKMRRLLKKEEVEEKSRVITNMLLSLKDVKVSSTVMCYMDFKNEVMTGAFIEYCINSGKKTAVPLVQCMSDVNCRNIIACEIKDPENDLQKGSYGILEPKSDSIVKVEPAEIDLVIVPGVVFDRQKYRIGFGAGYYDRFLKKVGKDCVKIGIAFEFQMVERVPRLEHDIPMDIIVTEKRII